MRIAVYGAGAWGTTMSIHLARLDHDVVLWDRDPDRVRRMLTARENVDYLPGFHFPDNLQTTSDPIASCDVMVGAVPTQRMRSLFERIRPDVPDAPFVSLAKGIEVGTGKLPTQIARDVLGEDRPTAVLTGPCIAREIARGMPTAVVVAGDHAEEMQEAFGSGRLRVYTSTDRLGAELCAALKNVLAIAAGVVDGMGLGDNLKGSLLTRGIVELARLGVALGAQAATFTGLAGFGDLFTTCVSPHSRNRGVGERIGRGEPLSEILESMQAVAEGVPTTKAVVALAEQHGVEMPIATALHAILFEGVPISAALGELMTRQNRPE